LSFTLFRRNLVRIGRWILRFTEARSVVPTVGRTPESAPGNHASADGSHIRFSGPVLPLIPKLRICPFHGRAACNRSAPNSTPGRMFRTSHGATRNPTAAASARWRVSNDTNSPARSDFAAATCRMSRLRVPTVTEWTLASREARRNTTGHFNTVFTSLPLRRSSSMFLHAAAASAATNKRGNSWRVLPTYRPGNVGIISICPAPPFASFFGFRSFTLT